MSDLDPLRPRPEEVARLASEMDAETLAGLRDALRPTSQEVVRLRARVRPARSPRWSPAWGAGLVLAALLLLVWVVRPEAAPLQLGVTLGVEATAIGPSIQTWGDARIVAEPHADGAIVIMDRGTAWFEVDPGGPARSLEVRAGDVAVTVTGTRFVVIYDDAVTVRVERGSVRVSHPGGAEKVTAGGSWTNRVVSVVEVPEAAAETSSPAPTIAATAPVPTPEARARPSEDDAPADEVPAAEAQSADEAQEEARTFAALLDRADRDDPDVILVIEAWLRDHPTGPLAAEAELLRLQALARTSPAQAERAASAWLSANPRGPRRADVLWLHATVARDGLQDCGLALPSYRELADVGPRFADASALQGLCAGALGRTEEARAALERAVKLGVDDALAKPVADALLAL